MTRIKSEIEKALQPLIGLPLTKATRSDSMQFFHFGKATITNTSGLILDVGAYTLAVQDGWQISFNNKMVVRSEELFMPKELFNAENFDWKVPGTSVADFRMKEFLKQEQGNLVVTAIKGEESGEVKLSFSNGAQLEVFCADERMIKETDGNTFWRFFSNTNPSESFIYNSAVM